MDTDPFVRTKRGNSLKRVYGGIMTWPGVNAFKNIHEKKHTNTENIKRKERIRGQGSGSGANTLINTTGSTETKDVGMMCKQDVCLSCKRIRG